LSSKEKINQFFAKDFFRDLSLFKLASKVFKLASKVFKLTSKVFKLASKVSKLASKVFKLASEVKAKEVTPSALSKKRAKLATIKEDKDSKESLSNKTIRRRQLERASRYKPNPYYNL
jgi:outer membrane murein-binding lipoprotein Lpp